MEQNFRDNLTEFFELTKTKPWGRLLAVQCTANDLIKWRQDNIHETLLNVLNTEGWQTESSEDWSGRNSSSDIFYIFKVHELWKSIRLNGTKSPVHVHAEAGYNNCYFHPSNNKIEVLCEYFPELPITVLWHDYDLLQQLYPQPNLNWFEYLIHFEITDEREYRELYNLDPNDEELELIWGWDWVKNIISNDNTWGKLKPRARDWRAVEDHTGDLRWDNALFLTVTDRYHRKAMSHNQTKLKDIIQVKPGQAKFCGKWYDTER